jgi:hypothetical protein
MFIRIYQDQFEFNVKQCATDATRVDVNIEPFVSKNNFNLPQRYLDAVWLQLYMELDKDIHENFFMEVCDEKTLQNMKDRIVSRLQELRRRGGLDVEEYILTYFTEESDEEDRTEAISEDRRHRLGVASFESSKSEDREEFHSSR